MDALTTVLDGITLWHWFALAGVLLVFELLTGTTLLLWPTAAALLVGAFAATPMLGGWQGQLAAFAVVTAALVLVGEPLIGRKLRAAGSDRPTLNDRAAELAGQTVIAAAAFKSGRGRVRVADSVWAAVSTDPHADVPAGAELQIVGVDGATLRVRPL